MLQRPSRYSLRTAHYLRNTRSQNHGCINTHEVCTMESVIWPPAIWLMPAWFKVFIQQTEMCKWSTAFYCQPTVLFVMLFKTEKQDWFTFGFIWHYDWNGHLKFLTNWTAGVWLCCEQGHTVSTAVSRQAPGPPVSSPASTGGSSPAWSLSLTWT